MFEPRQGRNMADFLTETFPTLLAATACIGLGAAIGEVRHLMKSPEVVEAVDCQEPEPDPSPESTASESNVFKMDG